MRLAANTSKSSNHSLDAFSRTLLDLMFPEANHLPATPAKTAKIPPVASTIRFDFQGPFFGELALPQWKAPSMPKIAIDEYGNPSGPKENVGPARNILGVLLESEAQRT